MELSGYVDADWGSNANGRKSQSGYLLKLCGGSISWASKRQKVVALSSTEAEYFAASLACQEAVWLRTMLEDIGFIQNQPTVIRRTIKEQLLSPKTQSTSQEQNTLTSSTILFVTRF